MAPVQKKVSIRKPRAFKSAPSTGQQTQTKDDSPDASSVTMEGDAPVVNTTAGQIKAPVKSRRARKVLRDSIRGIEKSSLRSLARRGGVSRMSPYVYGDARLAIKEFLVAIIKDIVLIVDHGNRKTIKVTDVLFALKKQGKVVYGFGN